MPERNYRVVVASTRETLELAANGWIILESTVREFEGLDSNHDSTYPDLGSLFANRAGWVALAFLDL